MALTNTAKTDIARMILEGVDPAWRAATSTYLALFTADPTATGSFTNEATYTGYARMTLSKDGDFDTVGDTSSNANLIIFPACTGGTNTITHVALCTAVSGGTMIQSKALNAPIVVSNLIEPKFSIGSITVTVS